MLPLDATGKLSVKGRVRPASGMIIGGTEGRPICVGVLGGKETPGVMGIVNVEGLLEPISGNAMENVEWCPTDIDASSSSKSSFVASVD